MDYEHYDGKVTTAEPGVSMTALEEAIPSLTVATIIGVALVVLVAIAIVFVLGVLIDCRQQHIEIALMKVKKKLPPALKKPLTEKNPATNSARRLLDERMGKMKRDRSTRSRRRVAPESDSTGIVEHEEAPATSLPPADMLRDVP